VHEDASGKRGAGGLGKEGKRNSRKGWKEMNYYRSAGSVGKCTIYLQKDLGGRLEEGEETYSKKEGKYN